ncbi:MAG TPA: hypothetical protein VEV39_04335 [Gemmatimonadales bacterium]|nr:hypothetical protein [Gemmatimonadales bacterium]
MWWPPQGNLATALAEAADRPAPFPGIDPEPDRPLRIFLAPNRTIYDSLTRGRLPTWSEGAAFPGAGAIVLWSVGSPSDLQVSLRHELAHVALRRRVRHALPLWFEEGYAAVAAGEWGRTRAFELDWHLLSGPALELDSVDRALRGRAGEAAGAYALATTAVAMLQRWGGATGLHRFIDALASEPTFDDAMRSTYHVTLDHFEELWAQDVHRRYGWLAGLGAATLFWGVIGLLLVGLVWRRRKRDAVRREALDEGWTIPTDEANP